MRASKKKKNIVTGEIVRRMEDGDFEMDITEMSSKELMRHIQMLKTQVAQQQLKLANLQITEAQEHLFSRQRSLLIEKYLREIAALDRATPGGLKSVLPSPEDDPDLVAEAWRIYVHQQRGGSSRF